MPPPADTSSNPERDGKRRTLTDLAKELHTLLQSADPDFLREYCAQAVDRQLRRRGINHVTPEQRALLIKIVLEAIHSRGAGTSS